MSRPTFLEYANYRFLVGAGASAAAAVVAYLATLPPGGRGYGGTWFGYLLGIVCAAIVLLLAWYGIRKRRVPRFSERRLGDRRKRHDAAAEAGKQRVRRTDRRKLRAEETWRYGALQGWLSAHVYLGALLVLLCSLHAGFRLGWNVHALAYVLVVLVVASGCYGVFAYLRYPRLIAENIGHETLAGTMRKIAELDDLAQARAQALPAEVGALVAKARQETRVGGRLLEQLSGRQRDCPTEAAVRRMQELGKEFIDGDQPRLMTDLYTLLLQKQQLVARARMDVRLNARLQFWLYVHAPLTVALLGALLAHVAAVLIYW